MPLDSAPPGDDKMSRRDDDEMSRRGDDEMSRRDTFVRRSDTTTVVLHGRLAKIYGRRHQLGVTSASEAAYALCALHPGFRADFEPEYYRVIRGTVAKGVALAPEMLTLQVGAAREIHFVPIAAGAKNGGVGKAILGAVIIVAAIALAPATGGTSVAGLVAAGGGLTLYGSAALFGAGLLLSGIASIVSPQPKNQSPVDAKTSFGLTGPVNSTLQGSPIPVVYGRTRVGSVVASLGYEAVAYTGTTPTATSGGSPTDDPSGYGVGTGSKGGKSGSSGGTEAPNTLQSDAIIRIIDILSQGPIGGLVNGAKSIFFNNTPLMAADGTYNFLGVSYEVLLGYPDQVPVSGYPAAEVTSTIGVQVMQQQPVIRTFTSSDANAMRVTIHIPALVQQNSTNGDLLAGPDLDFKFEIRPVGGFFVPVVTDHISGQKFTSPYQRSYRFDLPQFGTVTSWDVRMTRITADSQVTSIQNDTFWDSATMITDHKLIYPNTAYIALTIVASAFGSQIPTRAYEIDGILCQVPANYDPVGHTYATSGVGTSMGTWDGASFKTAVTNNPAWCLYDLLSNTRYGVGLAASALRYTQYDLFTISQYCDGYVPTGYNDGNGVATSELRYALNVAITQQDDAFRVLQNMVSSFRGLIYWGAGRVCVVADMPTVPSSVLNQTNVIDGNFSYEGTALKTRHTVCRVAWLDPQNSYQTTIEVVEDFDQVVTLGQVTTDIVAFGCTSRGLAHRLGKWLLDTEANQTDTMTVSVGLEQLACRPGDVVRVADPAYAGVRMGGRCPDGSTTTKIKLDSYFVTSSQLSYTISITLPDGTIVDNATVTGITVDPGFNGPNCNANLLLALPLAPAVNATWVLSSTEAGGTDNPTSNGLFPVVGREFRVMALAETSPGLFQLGAVFHDPNKYARVEYGLKFDPTPYSTLNQLLVAPVPPPSNVTAYDYLAGVGTTTLVRATVSFTPANDPRVVGAEARAIGPEQRTMATSGTTANFDGLQLGTYVFGVRSTGRDGRTSIWVDSDPVLVDGVSDPPSAVTALTAIGGAMQVKLTWNASSARDLLHYELWRAPAPNNGVHPFPFSSYTPTGTTTANGATLLCTVSGTAYTDSGDVLGPDEAWAYWIRPVSTTLVAGVFAGPARALTTFYLTDNLDEAIRNTAVYAQSLLGQAPELVTSLPATGTQGQLAFNTTNSTLYQWDHNANGGQGGWVLFIPIVPDSAGKISVSQISDIQNAQLGQSLTQAQINQLQQAITSQAITSDQITSLVGSKVTGALSNATLAAGSVYDVDPVSGNTVVGISAAKLLGTLNATKIVDVDPVSGNTIGGISAAKILGKVTTAQLPQIPTTQLTGDILASSTATLNLASTKVTGTLAAAMIAGQLAASQIAQIPTSQLTGTLSDVQLSSISAAKVVGQLVSSQIASIAAVQVTGTLTDAQLASISAAKVAGQLVASQIANIAAVQVTGTLTDAQLSAISAAKVTGQLVASQIANIAATQVTGTLTDAQLSALSAAKLTGLITTTQIGPNAVSAGQINAGAVSTAALTAGAVTANKLAIGGGTNVIWNPSCMVSTDGWVTGTSVQGLVVNLGFGYAGINLPNEGAGYFYSTGSLPSNQTIYAYWAPSGSSGTPCSGGEWIEAQARVAGYRVAVELQLQFFDSTGTYISQVLSIRYAGLGGGTTLDQYHPAWIKAQAPSNAASVRFVIYGVYDNQTDYAGIAAFPLNPGNQPYVFFTRALVGTSTPVPMAQSQPQDWAPGGMTSITGGVIQTNSIVARTIAAGTITGDKIAAATIVGGNIQGGTITGANIAGTTITGSNIAGTTITGTNIAGGTITGNNIAGNTITGTNILAGSVNANALVAGSVTATQLAAGSITASKLAIGGGSNVIWNPSCMVSTDGWVQGTSASGLSVTLSFNDPGFTLANEGTGYVMGAGALPLNQDIVVYWGPSGAVGTPCSGGEWIEAQARVAGHRCMVELQLQFFDSTGTFISSVISARYAGLSGGATLDGYHPAWVKGQAPSNAASVRFLIYGFNDGQSDYAQVQPPTYVAGYQPYLFFTRALVGTSTPVPMAQSQPQDWAPGGMTSITGGVIQTNSIVARSIAAGTISGDKIAANTITGGNIQGATITGTNIAGQTITGANIAGTTITGTNIAGGTITGGNILAGSVNATALVAGSITATQLAAGSVTTAALAVGSPNNSISNSCFYVSADGWGGVLPLPTIGNAAYASYTLDGLGSGLIVTPALAPSAYADTWYNAGQTATGRFFDASVAAAPGQVWEGQICYFPSYGGIELYVVFTDAVGNELLGPSSGAVSYAAPSNTALASWYPLVARGTAPTGTVAVGLVIRSRNTGGTTAACASFVSRALLGQTAVGATTALPWTPGGVVSIGGGIIQSNAIVARHIVAGQVTTAALAAGSVTAANLAVGSATNCIWNSSCVLSTDGWVQGGGTTTALGFGYANLTLQGEGTGYVQATGQLPLNQNIYAYWSPTPGVIGVPCEPGTWVEAQVRGAAHRCALYLYVQFWDINGTFVSQLSSIRYAGLDGGAALSGYHLAWTKGVVPANAATMRLIIYGIYDGQNDYAYLGPAPNNAGSNCLLFFTRASLGISTPVAMALSSPQPWAPGGITTVTGGIIQTGTIIGRNLLAGAVTTDKLSVGTSANVVWNSCCTGSPDGWVNGLTTVTGSVIAAVAATDTHYLAGYGSGSLSNPGNIGTGFTDANWWPTSGYQGVPVTPGSVWEAQAQVLAAACTAQLLVIWYDTSGNYISQTAATTAGPTDGGTGSKYLSNYRLLSLIVTAPSNAVLASLTIRMTNGLSAGAFVIFTQTMLAQTVANATQVSAWSPGGATQISGGAITTNSIASRSIAANAITAQKLAVGNSNNLIWNSCLAIATDGWSAAAGPACSFNNFTAAAGSIFAQYALSDGCGGLNTVLLPGGYVDVSWQPVSVQPGDVLEAQAMMLPVASLGQLYLHYTTAAGGHVGYSALSNTVANQAVPSAAVANTLAPFTLAWLIDTVPAGAYQASFIVRFASPQSTEADGFGIWTHCLLGKTVAGATQPSSWAPGGITTLSGGVLQSNSIVARTIAAGAITADKVTVAGSSNIIGNPTLPSTSWGWVFVSTCPNTVSGSVTGDNVASSVYALPGEGSGGIKADSMTFPQEMYAYWDPDSVGGVACLPGEWWELQAYLGAHRCLGLVQLQFFDASGALLADFDGAKINVTGGGGLSTYGFSWTKGQAPSNATHVRGHVVAVNDGTLAVGGGTAGVSPYLFFTRVVLARSNPITIAQGAQPQPYQIGGVTQVSGGQIKTGAITARAIAASAITANSLAVGSTTNVIYNACCAPSTTGWGSNPLPLVSDAPAIGLAGFGTGYVNGALASGGINDVWWRPNGSQPATPYDAAVACSPGDTWEAQAKVQVYRCSAQIMLIFTGPSGGANAILGSPRSVAFAGNAVLDRTATTSYQLISIKGVAPAGTTAVTVLLRAANDAAAAAVFGSNAGTSTYMFFTQVQLGPALPNAAPMPWGPGGITSINGGVIQAGTILAAQIGAGQITAGALAAGSVTTGALAANSVTAANATFGSINNLIWNSCPDQGSDGWNRFTGGPSMPPFGDATVVMDAASIVNPNWALAGLGSGFTQYVGPANQLIYSSQYFIWDWYPNNNYLPAGTGQRFGASALIAAGNNAIVYVAILFLDYNRNQLGATTYSPAVTNTGSPNGLVVDYYQRTSCYADAPAGTAYVVFRIYGSGLAAGSAQPFFSFSQAQLSVMPAGSTTVGNWTPGGTTTISGNMIKTGTLNANRITAGTITAGQVNTPSLTAALVTATTIKAQLVNANKLTADQIDGNTLTVGAVIAGAIGSTQIATGAINATHLASNFALISSAQVGLATIGAAQIQDLSVNGEKITPGAVTTAAVASTSPGNTPSSSAWSAYLGITIEKRANGSGIVLFLKAVNDFYNVQDIGGGGGGGGGGEGGAGL